jgi:hypothetical protein
VTSQCARRRKAARSISRGTITGADVCRLAMGVGYDAEAIASAWKTRAGFETGLREKALDAPLARVLPLG